MAVALGQPAMTENIEMETWRAIQVSFKSESFLLLVPDAEEPLERDRARSQMDGYPRVIEPMSAKAEVGLEKSLAEPARVQHLAFVGTGRLDPVQRRSAFATVVASKIEKPKRQ